MTTTTNPNWETDSLHKTHYPTSPQNWIMRCRYWWYSHWKPKCLDKPQVDTLLLEMNSTERSAEALRYSLLYVEYWLSPKGCLREWLRLNLIAASVLSIPTLLIVPLITILLGQVQNWITLLAATMSNLVIFPLSALLLLGLFSAIYYLAKSTRIARRFRHVETLNHPHYYED